MTTETYAAPLARSGSLLRAVLVADAAVCAVAGTAFLVATGPAADLFGAPDAAVGAVGVLLLLFAVAALWLARRPRVPDGLVKALVAADVVWAVDTVGLVALGWIAPTTTGLALVLLQAVGVLAFAGLKLVALRRDR